MASATRTIVRIAVPAHPQAEADYARSCPLRRIPNYSGDTSQFHIWRNQPNTAWNLSTFPGLGIGGGDLWWQRANPNIIGTYLKQGTATADALATNESADAFDVGHSGNFPQNVLPNPDTGNDEDGDIRPAAIGPAATPGRNRISDMFCQIMYDSRNIVGQELDNWHWATNEAWATRADHDGEHKIAWPAILISRCMTHQLCGSQWFGVYPTGIPPIWVNPQITYNRGTGIFTLQVAINRVPDDPNFIGVYFAQCNPDKDIKSGAWNATQKMVDVVGWPMTIGEHELHGQDIWPVRDGIKPHCLVSCYYGLTVSWFNLTCAAIGPV